MMNWLKEVFKTEKPIIAMCHLQALPGDSGYDQEKGMEWVIEKAREDLYALQDGGWMQSCFLTNSAFLTLLM